MEVWLPVPGYEGTYEVSNFGNVRRVSTGRILQHVDGPKGYPIVSLSQHGITKNNAVHRIVLNAFCGPQPFEGAQAAHNDGNTLNPRLTNLRWASPTENQADRIRHRTDLRGEAVFGAVLTEDKVREIRERLSTGRTYKQLGKEYGVDPGTIYHIKHRKTWKHVI